MSEEDRQIKYIKVGMDFTNTVTQRIIENLEGYEREEHLNNMKKIMADYLKMEHEYNTARSVIARLKKGLEAENADMDKDIEKEYNKVYRTELENIGKTDEDYRRDPRYLQLEQKMRGDGGGASGDDDLVMTQEHDVIPRDPWSQKELSEPLKSTVCGHVYEASVVRKNLQRSGKKALKCPVVGCVNPAIKEDELVIDQEIVKKIKKKKRIV